MCTEIAIYTKIATKAKLEVMAKHDITELLLEYKNDLEAEKEKQKRHSETRSITKEVTILDQNTQYNIDLLNAKIKKIQEILDSMWGELPF